MPAYIPLFKLILISGIFHSKSKPKMSTSAFVKKLAANDRPTRDAAFEALCKYIASKKSGLSLLDMEKLWKGLYFLMWLCDRPRPQERLAENLGTLYSKYIPEKQFCNLVEAFWVVMVKEWPSIDQWRIDKYLLLIRRVVRHCLIRLHHLQWPSKLVQEYNNRMVKGPLSGDKSVPVALAYHLCDIYLEEIDHVIFEDIREEGDELDESSEEYQEFLNKKIEIVKTIPVLQLVEPFSKLSKEAPLKTLREKCREEVLEDERLVQWGVVEATKKHIETEEDGEKEEEESEDEWTGF